MNLDAVLHHLRDRGYEPEPVPPLPKGFDRQREPDLFLRHDGSAVAVWTHDAVRETTVIQAQAAARKLDARALLVHDAVSDPARRWAQRYDVTLLAGNDLPDPHEEPGAEPTPEEPEAGDVAVQVPVADAAPHEEPPEAQDEGIWEFVEVADDAAEPPAVEERGAEVRDVDGEATESEGPAASTLGGADGEGGDDVWELVLPQEAGDEEPAADPEPAPVQEERPEPVQEEPVQEDPIEAEPMQAVAAGQPAGAAPAPEASEPASQGSAPAQPAAGADVPGAWSNLVAGASQGDTPQASAPDEDASAGGSSDGSGLRTAYADDEVELMVRETPREDAEATRWSDGNGKANPTDAAGPADAPANPTREPRGPTGQEPDDGTDAELYVSPKARQGNASSNGRSNGTSRQAPPSQEGGNGSRAAPSVSTDLDKIAEDVMRQEDAQQATSPAADEETGAELIQDRTPKEEPAREQRRDASSSGGNGNGSNGDGKPSDREISRHDPNVWGTSGRLDDVRTRLRGAGDSPHSRARGSGVQSSWLQGFLADG